MRSEDTKQKRHMMQLPFQPTARYLFDRPKALEEAKFHLERHQQFFDIKNMENGEYRDSIQRDLERRRLVLQQSLGGTDSAAAVQEMHRRLAGQGERFGEALSPSSSSQYPAASMHFLYPPGGPGAMYHPSAALSSHQQALDASLREEILARHLLSQRHQQFQLQNQHQQHQQEIQQQQQLLQQQRQQQQQVTDAAYLQPMNPVQSSADGHLFGNARVWAPRVAALADTSSPINAYYSNILDMTDPTHTITSKVGNMNAVASKAATPPSHPSHEEKRRMKKKKRKKMVEHKPIEPLAVPPINQTKVLASKVTKKPDKPRKVLARDSWKELGLGERIGTPAYNAHQRVKHEQLGLPPPRVVTALELATKMDETRCRSVYLPVHTPLQAFVETQTLDHESSKAQNGIVHDEYSSLPGHDDDQKKTAKSYKAGKKASKKKLSKKARAEAAKIDSVPLLHHALGRLYHTMCQQDADDYATDQSQSNKWSSQDVRGKLSQLQQDMKNLDEREAKLLKESKIMGLADDRVMEEAHRLLGTMPPEGC